MHFDESLIVSKLTLIPGPTLSLEIGHLPIFLLVELIPNKDDSKIGRSDNVPHVVEPDFQIIEARTLRHAVHQDQRPRSSVCSSKSIQKSTSSNPSSVVLLTVVPRHCSKALLSRTIPQLKLERP